VQTTVVCNMLQYWTCMGSTLENNPCLSRLYLVSFQINWLVLAKFYNFSIYE